MHSHDLKRSFITVFILGSVTLVGSGCLGVCLRTPVSDKVSNEIVGQCAQEAETNLDRRDLFDRYVRLLWARGEYRKILALCRQVLKQDPERTDARFFLAVGLRKAGHCKEALSHYRRYADRRPGDADPYFGMGLCYERLGRRGDARSAYKKYVTMEKRPNKRAWRTRAQSRIAALGGLAMLGAAGAAPSPLVAQVTPALFKPTPAVAKPAPVVAKPTLAVAKPAPVVAKPAPAAIPASCAASEAAIKKDPFDTAVYDRYGRCAAARKDYASLIRRMRVAIRDNPEWAKGWFYLGLAYRATGKGALAKSAFAKACSAGVSGSCNR